MVCVPELALIAGVEQKQLLLYQQPMTCFSLASFAHSSSVPFSVSSLSPPPHPSSTSSVSPHNSISSPSAHELPLLHQQHLCSTTPVKKTLNPRACRSISSFKDDISVQQRHHNLTSTSRNGTVRESGPCKRTQEDLLERIVHEVRRKREGDRESTPTVRALTWACRWVTVASDVDTIVAELDLPLSIFSSTLHKLGIEGKPQAAIAVFEWLQTAPGMLPNVYTYNSLLGALKANGCYDMAQGVFQQMQVNAVVPDVVTYNTLINLYELQGLFKDAVDLYNGLKGLGVEPTLFTFRNVIQILGKNGDVEAALGAFREFKQQQRVGRIDMGKNPVVELKREAEQRRELERIMTQLCCERFKELASQDRKKCGRVLQFLNRVKGSQVHLDAQAYEQLIHACRGDGEEDHKVVKVLYRQMRQQQVHMSVSLCNHVIEVLGHGKKWWAALEVYDHMLQDGPEPNPFTYRLLLSHFHVLLNAARNRGIWKWSLQLLDKMIDKGVEPDQYAWNAALIACARAGQTAAAVLVFQKMTERGQRPGIVSYGALLSALEKSASLIEAELVWEHMRKVGLKPNIVAYTTMISLYGKVGKYSEAMQLVKDMQEEGIEPSVITFNALITACARAGDGERAMDLMEQMKAAWVQPDAITYAQLIEAFANEGRWEPATAAYAKMQELELKPPAYALAAVVRVCKANNVVFDLQPSSDLAKA